MYIWKRCHQSASSVSVVVHALCIATVMPICPCAILHAATWDRQHQDPVPVLHDTISNVVQAALNSPAHNHVSLVLLCDEVDAGSASCYTTATPLSVAKRAASPLRGCRTCSTGTLSIIGSSHSSPVHTNAAKVFRATSNGKTKSRQAEAQRCPADLLEGNQQHVQQRCGQLQDEIMLQHAPLALHRVINAGSKSRPAISWHHQDHLPNIQKTTEV